MNSEQSLRVGLRHAGAVLKAAAVVSGLLRTTAVGLGVWLVLFAGDNLFHLPAGLRLPLALFGAAGMILAFLHRVCRPLFRRQGVERAARIVERRYGVGGNVLINACQFEAESLTPGERAFAGRTIREGRGALHGIPPATLWEARRLWRWGAAAAAVALAWGAYGLVLPRHVGNAFARYALPLGDIPPAGAVELVVTPGRDITVGEGDALAVRVDVRGVTERRAVAPRLVWMEGARTVPAGGEGGDSVDPAPAGAAGVYTHTFGGITRPFAFRVFAGDTYSRSVHVAVRPRPRIRGSAFRLSPPSYTGLPVEERPGPPGSVSGLAGSRLDVRLEFDRPVRSAVWRQGGIPTPMRQDGAVWTFTGLLTAAGAYEIALTDGSGAEPFGAATGEVGLKTDVPPQVDFETEARNRLVAPGAGLVLPLRAADDYGVAELEVVCRTVEATGPGAAAPVERILKSWRYLGPPGVRGPLKETFRVTLDPPRFVPGETYLLEAVCRDFSPGGAAGRSRPVIVRIKTRDELSVPAGDALEGAFALLRRAIEEQRKANGLTGNLKAHLSEALEGGRVPIHLKAMEQGQTAARGQGLPAVERFRATAEGALYAARLEPLVQHEMQWVIDQIRGLAAAAPNVLPDRMGRIEQRQAYLLDELIALLGVVSSARAEPHRNFGADAGDEVSTPPLTAEEAARDIRDELGEFAHSQRRIIEKSRTLLDVAPDDLTGAEEEILGALAREEAQWARFLEEALTDFSKLPLQDFADGALAGEFNEVVQEIKLAAKSLYDKKVELAVPQEQAGLESAEELIHNLERWLPDTPDHTKWSMEEPPQMNDIPLADLPAELEDIVGELLDREEEMADDVEDVTSSWMDSIDKGAGWDAMDGPISSMSAKGVTGNLLPNQQEVGGRAGEGRTGRSHGQMVEETAEGKPGRETPTRLTPSPFEPGSVEDSSSGDTGGATGGGKLSGFSEQGLRGPAPAPRLDSLVRLAGRQNRIRQEAQEMALTLRAYHLPTGDLETSIAAMQAFEEAASTGDGLGVRRAYSQVLDTLTQARRSIRAEAGLHRERSALPQWERSEILSGLRDGAPKGYEKMIEEYFRGVAEGNGAGNAADNRQ